MERLPGTGTILAGGLYGLPAVLGRSAKPTYHYWHLRLRAGTPGFSCGDGCHCRRSALAPGDEQWEDGSISRSRGWLNCPPFMLIDHSSPQNRVFPRDAQRDLTYQ